jgi:geranylgeranyl diphosphate/geranylgeranyl-bacteriochlorophyllide a reductase
MTGPGRAEYDETIFDVAVIGGGPSGATAAHDLARRGARVALVDRAGRIKPCGGAIPPRLIRDFAIPDHLIVARITSARMVSPRDRRVDMPIEDGFVGMVDRETFDEWLRVRAADSGARRVTGSCERLSRDRDGVVTLHLAHRDQDHRDQEPDGVALRARVVIVADGARSAIAREEIPQNGESRCVFAYHEIVRPPAPGQGDYDRTRCDVYYKGALSPDFYAWVFPHGDTCSIGVGSARKGFGLRDSIRALRASAGLDRGDTIRREGAPIPLKPLKRWDNGRDLVLAGDAAGVVAPASGEGIYYAMLGGRLAADAALETLRTGDARYLAQARRRFMKDHGRIFWILGMMQYFWYGGDRRRERFVSICGDRDVQRLTWEAYMNKELGRPRPLAHARIFFKDLAHLFGVVSP